MLGLYDLDEAYYDDLKVKSSLRVSVGSRPALQIPILEPNQIYYSNTCIVRVAIHQVFRFRSIGHLSPDNPA